MAMTVSFYHWPGSTVISSHPVSGDDDSVKTEDPASHHMSMLMDNNTSSVLAAEQVQDTVRLAGFLPLKLGGGGWARS